MRGRAKKSDFGVAVFYPQPVWFRILKYTLVFGMLYFLWGDKMDLDGLTCDSGFKRSITFMVQVQRLVA